MNKDIKQFDQDYEQVRTDETVAALEAIVAQLRRLNGYLERSIGGERD